MRPDPVHYSAGKPKQLKATFDIPWGHEYGEEIARSRIEEMLAKEIVRQNLITFERYSSDGMNYTMAGYLLVSPLVIEERRTVCKRCGDDGWVRGMQPHTPVPCPDCNANGERPRI